MVTRFDPVVNLLLRLTPVSIQSSLIYAVSHPIGHDVAVCTYKLISCDRVTITFFKAVHLWIELLNVFWKPLVQILLPTSLDINSLVKAFVYREPVSDELNIRIIEQVKVRFSFESKAKFEVELVEIHF